MIGYLWTLLPLKLCTATNRVPDLNSTVQLVFYSVIQLNKLEELYFHLYFGGRVIGFCTIRALDSSQFSGTKGIAIFGK